MDKKFRDLYIKKCKLERANQILSIKLHEKIDKFIGRESESFELEFAVDTLNEGYGNLSFEDFIKELNKLKKKKAQEIFK